MPGFELIGVEEKREVLDVLENGVFMRYGFDGMRNGHWKARELEKEITSYFGVKYAQLCSSGTAALSVAMAALGIGYGDEVIMPTFTFVASFEAIIAAGAVPVLVDIDETLCINPAAAEKAITPKTKAIMPVYMCGSMAKIDELQAICKKHKLFLIEDACQAIGGSYHGKMLGSIGDIGCFSFDYVKTMTCGEGGVVMTNNQDYYIMADGYTDHGHDHIGNDRGAESHPFIGYNYRISELHAAVGLAQIRKIDQVLATQRRNNAIIKNALSKKVPGISFREIPDPKGDNASFLSFYMPTETDTRLATAALKQAGIDGVFYWYDNNWHYIRKWEHLKQMQTLNRIDPQLKERIMHQVNQSFPISDSIMSRTISVLIKISWSLEDVENRANKMANAIASIYG